jgi:hypothetical protein
MDNQISLNIKTPCTENFNEFTATKNGGFCQSCEKEVFDFTKMSAQEITHYFQTKKTQDICGIFERNQLTINEESLSKGKKISFLSGLGLAFLSLFYFGNVHAQDINNQTKTLEKKASKFQSIINKKNIDVKGTVTEDKMPLPGVNILLEGTTVGTSTDFDGNFEFPEKLKKGDVLVFSYVGMNSKKVVITNEKSTLDVTLKVNLKMDSCMLMGKVAVKKIYKSKRD